MTTATTMTARDVLAALYRHFNGRWAMITEVTARAPRESVEQLLQRARAGEDIRAEHERQRERHRERRIDALLLRMADVDGGIERLAIEVKVSRADFLADVRNPAKQAPWRAIAHRHAYAVPAGLVSEQEVPGDSGLIVVRPAEWGPGTVKFARRAPSITGHQPGPLPLKNVMDAFWRAGRAEALMKGLLNTTADGVHVTGDAEELRARVAHLTRDVEAARNDAERAREQRDVWRRRYAAHEPPTCGTCGQPLHPGRSLRARRAGHEWEHRDEVHAAVCEGLRKLAAEEAYDVLPADERRWRRAEDGGPQPGDYQSAATDVPA
jgi:outer membrane murein-binding lipoprotein Lpp